MFLSKVGNDLLLGKDVSHHFNHDHNLKPGPKVAFFQREVAYDNLPDMFCQSMLPKKPKCSNVKWLSKHDRDTSPDINAEGRNYAGLGIYYFEEPFSKRETK